MGVDARQEFYAENFSYPGPVDIPFRAFMHGAGVAAVCGEFRWQIASSAARVVPSVAAYVVGVWSCSSGELYATSLVGTSVEWGMPMWLTAMFVVVQWVALLGMNVLIWKGLRPLKRSMGRFLPL